MRYYDLQITNPDDGKLFRRYSSLIVSPTGIGGVLPSQASTNVAALNVEMDIQQYPFHSPGGQSLIRLWGIGLNDFGNATNFNNKLIKVYGGMQKGLPLANPAQAGLLIQGQIFQAFGNWIGTDITLTFILIPAVGFSDDPKNIMFVWRKGTSLVAALQTCFNVAFPGARQNITIGANLVTGDDQVHFAATLSDLAIYLNDKTQAMIKTPNYPGVVISYDGATIVASDQPNQAKAATRIGLGDLIGQPMWIEPLTIQCRFVMRADLNLGDIITLPQTPVTTSAAALTQFNDKLTFSGNYKVTYIRHVGNLRQPDGSSWSTTVNLIPVPK